MGDQYLRFFAHVIITTALYHTAEKLAKKTCSKLSRNHLRTCSEIVEELVLKLLTRKKKKKKKLLRITKH